MVVPTDSRFSPPPAKDASIKLSHCSGGAVYIHNTHNNDGFHMWEGDTDRDVDMNDLMNLSTYYGTPGPHDYTHGDSDYDNDVDLNDHSRLAGKYGTTLAAPPTSIEEISVSGVSASEIFVDWLDDPNLTETSYRIRLSTDGINFLEEDFHTVDGSQTSLNITGLDDGTQYWVTLRRFASQGNTAYTPHEFATTVLPGPDGPFRNGSFQHQRPLELAGQFRQ